MDRIYNTGFSQSNSGVSAICIFKVVKASN